MDKDKKEALRRLERLVLLVGASKVAPTVPKIAINAGIDLLFSLFDVAEEKIGLIEDTTARPKLAKD